MGSDAPKERSGKDRSYFRDVLLETVPKTFMNFLSQPFYYKNEKEGRERYKIFGQWLVDSFDDTSFSSGPGVGAMGEYGIDSKDFGSVFKQLQSAEQAEGEIVSETDSIVTKKTSKSKSKSKSNGDEVSVCDITNHGNLSQGNKGCQKKGEWKGFVRKDNFFEPCLLERLQKLYDAKDDDELRVDEEEKIGIFKEIANTIEKKRLKDRSKVGFRLILFYVSYFVFPRDLRVYTDSISS